MKIKKWLPLIFIIIISFVAFVWYFGIGGLIAGIFETLLFGALAKPNEATGILASIYKALRGVNFWFERSAVEKRLEGTIGASSSKLNDEGFEILPHGIDVKWVESKDRDAFLKDNKIVVCLESSQNEARNLARATMLYTSADLIRESQRFIDPKVMKSACITTARKMLMLDRKIDAFKCLNEEFLQPEIEKSDLVEKYVNIMEKLDSRGRFTRLVLNELFEIGEKLSTVASSPRAISETQSFMKVMGDLANKEKGVDINPNHRGKIIDFGIILVARDNVINPTPYINYAKRCWDEGIPKLYVMARGRKIRIAMAAVAGIKTSGIYRVDKESKYTISEKRGSGEYYLATLSRLSA
ncbi:MAG: hypothetical protein WC325_02595 [Candidatus Bathyarchaeia archaeon]|jgi:hypothetical protein